MNDGKSVWGDTEYMLADLYDAVMHNAWLVANRGLKESERSKQPTPYPRPGAVSSESTSKVSADALEEFKRRTYGKG